MNSNCLSLKEMQQANLSALVEIDRICRENRLRYFLAYGTMLGAVRHRGFIPWDDDVDIFMSRKDIDALYRIMGNEVVNGFKLCTRENTQNYPYYIPRFCNMKYKYESELNEPLFDIGAFVDIYPLDNYCNDEIHGRKLWKRIQKMNSLYMVYNNRMIGKNLFLRIISFVLGVFLHLAGGEKYPDTINRRIEKYVLTHTSDQDKYVGVPTWTNMFRQYNRELFQESIEIPFEDHLFFIPKEYDTFLKITYGDYMKLPPEEKRKASHFYRMYIRDESFA